MEIFLEISWKYHKKLFSTRVAIKKKVAPRRVAPAPAAPGAASAEFCAAPPAVDPGVQPGWGAGAKGAHPKRSLCLGRTHMLICLIYIQYVCVYIYV